MAVTDLRLDERCVLERKALIVGFENPLFTATEAAVRGRVKFHAAAEDANIDWTVASATAGALATL
jgi:hypothetical protein